MPMSISATIDNRTLFGRDWKKWWLRNSSS